MSKSNSRGYKVIFQKAGLAAFFFCLFLSIVPVAYAANVILAITAQNGTVNRSPQGTLVTGGYAYPVGTVVKLTVTPKTGYAFSRWSGDVFATTYSVNITLNSNKAVIAYFAPYNYSLTIAAQNGVVTKKLNGLVTTANSFKTGTVVELTAIANSGYSFSGWSGNLSGKANPAKITIGASKSVTAKFALQIQVPAISIQPQSQTIDIGSSVAFSITATGIDPLTYQWQKKSSTATDFINISGATSDIYTFTPITSDDAAQFRCVVTNSMVSVTSAFATLTLQEVDNNPGELINSGGGMVTSQDGKVGVVIPAGALSSLTRIRVSKVNKGTLKEAAPSGKSLLSVVECKPYGLVFTKPVKIIYSLDQAEIPGTAVELGFYDSIQDKIISTGQTTTVSADGYTVNFSLVHFSTYAALKSLAPQSTPMGSGVKIPLPDMFTGAFSHAIPISVPPGRKGMQPALGLSYRSSNSNSWVGLGFSLNPGYITRSTRLGPPSYNDQQDTFYFISDSGATELVYLTDNVYQAKIESSFTKFFKESNDSWKAVGKDGSILKFGQEPSAKETSTQGTFSWYLTRLIDTNGNYIQYNYIKDQGKSYLSRIDYTGNEIGVSPTNSVEFFLESRNDIPSSYISSSKIATAKRLKEITVKVNYDLAWRYVLEYNYSPDTNRSLLKLITQYGSDDKSLPSQAMSYQQAK